MKYKIAILILSAINQFSFDVCFLFMYYSTCSSCRSSCPPPCRTPCSHLVSLHVGHHIHLHVSHHIDHHNIISLILNQSPLVDNCEKEVICCCCGGVFSQNRLSSLHATLCHIPVLRHQALRYERYKIIGQFGTLDNLPPEQFGTGHFGTRTIWHLAFEFHLKVFSSVVA